MKNQYKNLSSIGILKELSWMNKCRCDCRKNWLSWLMIIAPDQVWIFKKQINEADLRGY